MSVARNNLDDALRAAASGDLDALAPEQVAALESLLNADAELASRLAGSIPRPDPRLADALAGLEKPAIPTARQWSDLWERIEARTDAAASARHQVTTRILRLWKPLTAAAACLVLATLWRMATPRAPEPWPLRLATDVEINALEVYDDGTPFVVATGGDNGVAVIWVLEKEG